MITWSRTWQVKNSLRVHFIIIMWWCDRPRSMLVQLILLLPPRLESGWFRSIFWGLRVSNLILFLFSVPVYYHSARTLPKMAFAAHHPNTWRRPIEVDCPGLRARPSSSGKGILSWLLTTRRIPAVSSPMLRYSSWLTFRTICKPTSMPGLGQIENHADSEPFRFRTIQIQNHSDLEPCRLRTIQIENHSDWEPFRLRTIQSENHSEWEPYRLRTIQIENHSDWEPFRLRTI